MQITEFLTDHQVAFESVPHAPAFSAHKLAKYLRISGRHVAKAVLLYGAEGFMLAILPATHKVDVKLLEDELGGPIRLATEQEIAWMFRDCEWGVRMPFGRLYGVSTLLEDGVGRDSEIVFEAHFHAQTIRMACRDFERLEKPQRLHFAEPRFVPVAPRRNPRDW